MSRFNPHHDEAPIHQAARAWTEACLLQEGSALAPGKQLCTPAHLDELHRHFVQNLDEGEGNFLEKLQAQLRPSSPEAKQLMAELLWLMLLFPTNIGAASKRSTVRQVWSWSGVELPADHPLLSDETLEGLGSAGTAYLAHRWRELVFLINALRALRKSDRTQIDALLGDGWRFVTWLYGQPDGTNRQLSHILPHLFFPDLFERISSGRDKVEILGALTKEPRAIWRKRPLPEIDKALLNLRTQLETQAGRPIDFYEPELKPKWKPTDVGVNDGGESVSPDQLTPAAALNTILFGPPGTGKTYATMFEAVAICDGRARAQVLSPEDLRARYTTLREAGRIAFATFHQSYSYEDFVEGLRPETEIADGAGFRLVPRPGILRQMADLAARGRSASAPTQAAELDEKRVFKMSLGRAHNEDDAYIFDDCVENGQILLGWGGSVDWSPAQFDTFKGILQGWQEIEPGATGNNYNVKAIWSLRNDMRVGDIVIVSNGNLAFRAVGIIEGPYEFVDRAGEDEYQHRRRVRWTWVDQVGLPVSTILDGQFSQQSIYRITKSKLKLEALAAYLAPPQAVEHLPHVLVIDEINRANVSKVFGELITLLEEDKRAGAPNAITVRLPYSGESFSLPPNLHILGTMNTADRSIALLDTALRRRFSFVEMPPRPDLLSADQIGLIDGLDLSLLLTWLNERIEYLFDRDHLIGHAFFMGATSREDVDRVMQRKVIPLLAEYFHEDWERIVAVLGGPLQRFIVKAALPVPPGLDAEGETRWRYTVRDHFPEDAYAGLQP